MYYAVVLTVLNNVEYVPYEVMSIIDIVLCSNQV